MWYYVCFIHQETAVFRTADVSCCFGVVVFEYMFLFPKKCPESVWEWSGTIPDLSGINSDPFLIGIILTNYIKENSL